ncbi:polyhydroxyalkanoic acid system family protein [Silanimonas algicola]
MTDIDIHRNHRVPLKEAKARVERIAERIAERFDVAYGWKGNTLQFSRSGVDGQIAVTAKDVRVMVRLGFLLFALKGSIEREVDRVIDEQFR